MLQAFRDHNGDRIGLLSRGAAWNPDAKRTVLALVFQNYRQALLPERFEGFRVPEKIGDADEQFFEQQIQFVGVLLEELDVLPDMADLMNVHTALDAPEDRITLVEREVVSRMGAQQREDACQRGGRCPLLHGLAW